MSQGFTGKNFTFQRWDGLYHPIKNLSLNMSTFTTAYNWATGTSTDNLLSLTTDASANGTGALLNIATGTSSTVLPLVVKAGSTTALTVNASAQVLIGTLSSSRVTYAGASGLLQDSANFTFNGNRISLSTTGNTGGLLIGGDTNLYRFAADVLQTDDSFVAGGSITAGTNVVAQSGYISSGLGGGGYLGALLLLGDSSGTVTIQPQSNAGTYNFNLPTTAGSSGHVLTSGGGGGTAMTWTDPASLAVRWNSIANPNGNQSLTMSTHTTTWNWATGTSTNNLLNLTTDASANGTGALLRIATGASSTVVPLLVVAAGTTALTVNASAQVLVNSLTSGRVTYAGTNGLLQDSSSFTFDGSRLSLTTTGSSGGLLIGGDANLFRSAADVLKTDDSFWVASRLTVGEDPATYPGSALRISKYPGNDTYQHIGGNFLVWNTSAYTRTLPAIGVLCDHYYGATSNVSAGLFGGQFNMNVQSTKNTGTISNVAGGKFTMVWSATSTATGDDIAAAQFNLSSSSATANLTTAYGIKNATAITSGHTITNLHGIYTIGPTAATSTITNYNAIYIASPTTATITNHYGVYVEDLGIGTNRYAIYLAGTSGTARQGITWNGDTNLYRSAADTLKTDDSLVVTSNLTVSTLTSGRVSYSSTGGLFVDSSAFTYTTGTGQLALSTTGSGAGILIGGDAQLYRSAADVLRTPDSLTVDQNFIASGTATIGKAVNSGVVTLTDGATPALDASLGNTFLLTAAGNRTIAVPTNPTSGQKITIVHKASGADRTLALNTGAGGFRFGTDITALTATTSGLTDYIGCIYNAADSKWDIVSYVKGF